MPEDVIDHYQLQKIVTPDDFVYCKIQKGMYGLPQARIIAQELLTERLAKHGYIKAKRRRDYGPMKLALFGSAWWSTILE